jgi:thymidine phosphorylase
VRRAVHLDRPGTIAAINARALGLAVVGLGGGRQRVTDRIDPRVGLAEVRGIGEAVGPDAPLAIVHAATDSDAAAAAELLRNAVDVLEDPPETMSESIIEHIAPHAIRP